MLPVHNFGWKCNNSDLCCRGARVAHLQETLLSLTKVVIIFLWPFIQMTEWHLKLGRTRFLPYPLIFTVC